jgi:hypothetical protein|nr:MAG TPA: hypothetical protein [Caudoviricetes sp.]
MYKVIRKDGFKDLQDETQHIYEFGNDFPYDGREVKESRLQELATDLNKVNEPCIALESDLLLTSKKDIIKLFEDENLEYDKNAKKEDLIIEYEYQKSRRLLKAEVEEMNLEISEEISNYQIVELILKNQK